MDAKYLFTPESVRIKFNCYSEFIETVFDRIVSVLSQEKIITKTLDIIKSLIYLNI